MREGGVYRSEIAIAAGDILRIAVAEGSVKYSKNGTVFYTSSAQPAYPLVVNAALLDLNATIVNVMMGMSSSTLNAAPAASHSNLSPLSTTGRARWRSKGH